MEQQDTRRPLASGYGHKCTSCFGSGENFLTGICFPCNGSGRVRSWVFVGQESGDRILERIARGES